MEIEPATVLLPRLSRRAALFSLALLAGCGSEELPPPPVEADVRISNTSWDQGSVLFWTWNDAVLFAVWTNRKLRARGEGAFKDGVARFHGALVDAQSQPVVEVEGTSSDGKTGRVVVNGQRCDIARGWLVLYMHTDSQLRFRQLPLPLLACPPGSGNVFAPLRQDPKIQAFFSGR